MQITLNNKNYELDVPSALDCGALQKVSPPITNIQVGDVFDAPNQARVVVGQIFQDYSHPACYFYLGFSGLQPYSTGPLYTKQEIVADLNKCKFTFVCNINDKVKQLIRDAKTA